MRAVRTALYSFAALYVAVSCGGCGLLFLSDNPNGLADRYSRRSVEYNLRGVERSDNAWRVDQHILALDDIADRMVVPRLLKYIENLEAGLAGSKWSPSLRRSMAREVSLAISRLAGISIYGKPEDPESNPTSRQWHEWLDNPDARPPIDRATPSLSYPNRDSGLSWIGNDPEEALVLWREWWHGGITEHWRTWYPKQLWKAHYPHLFPYIRTLKYGFELDRGAQLCGVPLDRWDKLPARDKDALVKDALSRRGIAYQDWQALLVRERNRTSLADEKRASDELNKIAGQSLKVPTAPPQGTVPKQNDPAAGAEGEENRNDAIPPQR